MGTADDGEITCSTWDEVEAAVDQLAAKNPDIEQQTVETAKNLAKYGLGRYRVPDEVSWGYWPTLRLHWLGERSPLFEIEIYSLTVEVYTKDENGKGFNVRQFEAVSEFISGELSNYLDTYILLDDAPPVDR